jgi:hypothetical protein
MNVINFLKEFLPSRQEEGVLSQYQKIALDNTFEPAYTDKVQGNEKALEENVSIEFTVNAIENKYTGKVVMLEDVMEKEVKKPVVTVETIVNAVENKYPKAVVELAKILRDMKVQYSLHASAFSAKLFDAQDTLGLSSNEVRDIMDEIISQKDVIITTTQASIDIINKPKVI